MAAAAIVGVARRTQTGVGLQAKGSLAATGHLLMQCGLSSNSTDLRSENETDLCPASELTEWGPAKRLLPPVKIRGTPMAWDVAASPIGAHSACWH
jgi:hypothetical protein